jgi:hypothetical protein
MPLCTTPFNFRNLQLYSSEGLCFKGQSWGVNVL